MRVWSIRSLAWVGAILALLPFRPNISEAAYLGIDPSRHHILPQLTINDVPDVCEALLAEVRARFLSTDSMDMNRLRQGQSWQEGRWNGFDLFPSKPVKLKLGTYEVEVNVHLWDIDGDGEQDVIASFHRTLFSQYHYELHRVPTSAVVGDAETEVTGYLSDPSAFSARRSELITAWNYIPLIAYGEEPLIYYKFSHLRRPTEPVKLFRFGIDLELSPVCQIEFPAHSATSKGKQPVSFDDTGAFGIFIRTAERALGEPVSCMNSSNMQMTNYYYNKDSFDEFVWNVVNRPWAVPLAEGATVSANLDAGDDFLKYWAKLGLWEYRIYGDIKSAREGAFPELRAWYDARYGLGLEQAESIARQALVSLSARLTRYRRPDQDLNPAPGNTLAPDFLSGPSEDEVLHWIEQEPGSPALSSALFAALAHPDLVRLLLEQGADPNRGNHFGKTPLMYAAHFNLLESARLLLKYGADPNRRTTAKADRVCNSFKWIGRTALMYAAENADEAMMALLIEAGADIEARDLVDYWRGPGTPDRSVHDYLDLNANLSLAEKAQISARWGLSALPGAN